MGATDQIGRVWNGISTVLNHAMVYGYIALFMVWAGLITYSAFRIEGLDEGILASIFLVGPAIIALGIRLRDDLAGVERGGLGGSRGEVAEDYAETELGSGRERSSN